MASQGQASCSARRSTQSEAIERVSKLVRRAGGPSGTSPPREPPASYSAVVLEPASAWMEFYQGGVELGYITASGDW